jgi:hypothetical protein
MRVRRVNHAVMRLGFLPPLHYFAVVMDQVMRDEVFVKVSRKFHHYLFLFTLLLTTYSETATRMLFLPGIASVVGEILTATQNP